MKAIRAALPASARQAGSMAMVARLLAQPAYRNAQVVAAYASFRDEADTAELCAAIWRDGKTLILPRINSGGLLQLHVVKAHSELQPNRFGIYEPAASSPSCAAHDVELFVVPGLAFDMQGGRLGFGRGYYDRLLATAARESRFVGFGFDCQVVAPVPCDARDVRMHMVVTEQRWIARQPNS